MNIVVLDAFALNPGDLTWAALEQLGDCRIYDRSAPEEAVARAEDAEIVLTNKVLMSADVIARLPKLEYIGILATGVNCVDLEAARRRGITVSNVPEYSTKSVAQMTFALLLELVLHVGEHSRGVREGKWSKSIDFSYHDYPLTELDGLTLGIVGLGQIGRAVSGIASAFGMRVIAHSRSSKLPGVEMVTLDDVFRTSDVVSLHVPLTDQTEGLVDSYKLGLMKPTAYFINTARGALVVEQDLADALNSGRIAGAALDVLSTEPPNTDNPLLVAKNCIITPHIAWAIASARSRLMQEVVANVRAFIEGNPRNVVS